MAKTYSMWMEKLPNGKYKYSKKFVDPVRSVPGKLVFRRVSVTLEKKTPQARKKADDILNKKISDKLDKKALGTDITLKELTDKYMDYLKKTDRPWNTRMRALGNFKFINQYFDGAIAKNITTPMINRYLEYCLYERPRKLSNSSTRLRKVFLSNAYRYGKKFGLVNVNPVKNVEVRWRDENNKKREKIENKFFTDSELRAVLGYCKYVVGRIDYYYLFKFLSLTGLRIAEVSGITKKDIIQEDGKTYCYVRYNQEYHYGKLYHEEEEGTSHSKRSNRTKTKASLRKVQLDRKATYLVNQLMPFRDDTTPLFLNNYFNSEWQAYSVDNYLKIIARKLGINKKLSSHYFRHTYISKLAENHVPLNVIMAQVGQADSEITKSIYTHVTEKERIMLDSSLKCLDSDIGI